MSWSKEQRLGARGILFLCVLLFSACGQDSGNVVVALQTGALTGPMADPGTPVVDDDGLTRLDWYPLFLVIVVEATDLEAPVIETWPAVVPESTPEVVELELDVPAGSGRQLTVELLLSDDVGDTVAYSDPPPSGAQRTFDIEAGQVTDVDVELVELPRGTVVATLSPDTNVESLSWIDDDAGAVYPPSAPIGGSTTTELTLGRVYWPRVQTSDGDTLDFPMQSVSLTTEGQTLEVTIEH